ncbi:hypothetical protein SmJEL517_g00068 [Synchytrium microbalum]|uniref:SCA7 domain-containing protein n=1 Tax=Synchytrium microbalum TaxID=1806994 RepID=A0A507CJN8_9FUNG|nr:uncharacterized protein SmJEL517_g00068 [Synchytrium microbalum]TPX38045.1 hypothetical protein SmJEL517_g00068 [Synchytrium microbalum]
MSVKSSQGSSWTKFRTDFLDPETNNTSPEEGDSNPYGLAIGDEVPVVTCNGCSRPVLQTSLLAHLEICTGADGPSNKKIKTEHPPINSYKEESPPIMINDSYMTGKSKKGINLDEQCGVLIDGIRCTRSILCKKHPVAQKRAVMGRCKPYDVLALRFGNASQQRSNSNKIKAGAAGTVPPKPSRLKNGIPDMVTSEDETQSVFDAIRFHIPQPIATLNYPKVKRYTVVVVKLVKA